ncbi:MAG: YbgA family protein [Gammaproteobacteria bacterium]
MDDSNQPHIGVSACLLGQPVRFDGGQKKSRFLLDDCAGFFQFHLVCPEVELGMEIPQLAIKLGKFQHQVKRIYSKNPQHDLSHDMQSFSGQRINDLRQLDGFVFKQDSPSCGPQSVPAYDDISGMQEKNGIGIFASSVRQMHPLLPVEDEGRLNDNSIRENFLERVYAHLRWRNIEHADSNLAGFQDFHQNYKLMLMAKSAVASRELGQLVAIASKKNLQEIRQQYIEKFMQIMQYKATPGQQVNVLMHILGYLKSKLDHEDKLELLTWFENYRQQRVSRVIPMALLQHHFRRYPNDYMARQYYFFPFPDELMQPV